MNLIVIFETLILLALANGAPVVAKVLFGNRFAQPIDFGLHWFDGHRLFGSSKTFRGILASVFACGAGGILLGLEPDITVPVAAAAMLGDLLSSFIKRRLAIEPSGQAIALDYILEALFPALLVRYLRGINLVDVAVIVVVFWILAAGLSPLLYRLGIRDRPY